MFLERSLTLFSRAVTRRCVPLFGITEGLHVAHREPMPCDVGEPSEQEKPHVSPLLCCI